MISDEVYGRQAFGSNPFIAMGEFGPIVPVVTLGSLSKQWVVPGWRIGWIVTCDPNGVLKSSGVFLFSTFPIFTHSLFFLIIIYLVFYLNNSVSSFFFLVCRLR